MKNKKIFIKLKSCLVRRIILLLALTVSTLSVFASAQTISVRVQNGNLDDVFKQIKNNSNYYIVYNSGTAKAVTGINIDLKDATVEEVLNRCLNNTSLSYTIKDETIIINQQQESKKLIKGKVIDAVTEAPLPFVSVYVLGTKTGTTTKDDGSYELQVPESAKILIVSMIGYEEQRFTISDQKEISINVALIEKVASIDDVVVTGYQELSKERVTGSFGKITQEQLDRTIAYSIVEKIEGLAGGVLFDPLGITIRGVSTLSANRMPLIVIDDFPITIDDVNNADEMAALKRALESINPADVASVTVLKDAAAASIWGVRASNGVIVITTKRTSSRAPEIDMSVNFMFSPKPDVSKLPYSSPQTFLEMETERYNAKWFDTFITNMDKYYYTMSDMVYYSARFQQGMATQQQLNDAIWRVGNLDNRYEFSDLFLRGRTQQQYNLSVRQNTTFNNYSFSASYDKVNSIFKQTDNDRLTINFKNTFKPSDYIQAFISANIILRKDNDNGVTFTDLFNTYPYERILDGDGNYLPMNNFSMGLSGNKYQRKDFYEANKNFLPYDWDWNVKREFDNKNNVTKSSDMRLQAGITITPFGNNDMLKFSAQYQYERNSTRNDNLQNTETYYVRNMVNNYAQTNNTYPVPKGCIFDQAYGSTNSHNLRFTGNFYKTFDNKHTVTLLGGLEIRETYNDRSQSRRYGYDEQTQVWAKQMDFLTSYPRNFYPTNSYSVESGWSTIMNYTSKIDRFLSYFGNASYTFANKYDITGSFRLDKSNMFGRSKQYREVPLYSVGIGWLITKENFFSVPWIDRLKIRATYGSNGNIDKTTSPYTIAEVTGTQNNSYINVQGAEIINPANPLLSWEKTKTVNIGIDFTLLDNKVNGKIDLYNRSSSDLLSSQLMNSTLGFTSAKINYGAMNNKGIELELMANPVTTGSVRWTTQLLYTYNHNNVVKGGSGDVAGWSISYIIKPSYYDYRILEGKPRYYFMALEWGGLDERGFPTFWRNDPDDPTKRILQKYDDPSRTITFDECIYVGPSQAPHFGSWTNSIYYKNFDLSFMIQYKFGHYYKHTSPFDVSNNDLYGFQQGNIVPKYHVDFDKRWKNPGDETTTDIPRLPTMYVRGKVPTYYYSNIVCYGTHQYASAAHLRFSRVTLNYRLSEKVLPKYMKNLVFSFQVRNIGCIAFNKWGEDPENLPDMYGASLQRTAPEYTFNIRASF
jgi:TonB-linked SusC/RagA family outer membrane protein